MADLRRFVDGPMTKVTRYKDYREMLEKQKDIDAIIIATPNNMHAAIASAAMELGKHVYCEKPLCWSVKEAGVAPLNWWRCRGKQSRSSRSAS